MGIAENLKAQRGQKKISQEKLAKLSGVSQQLISQIENGKNTSTKSLPDLAKALECSVSDLDPAYSEPVDEALAVFLELYRTAPVDTQLLAIDLAIMVLNRRPKSS
jgi:transcriptional regulator with XRE-family HTH domain